MRKLKSQTKESDGLLTSGWPESGQSRPDHHLHKGINRSRNASDARVTTSEEVLKC